MVMFGIIIPVPRGDQKILYDPFRTWVVTVDENNRVPLPLEIRDVVPWIDVKTGQIECVGMPGPSGGIQVAPLTVHRQEVLAFAEAIAETAPSPSESPQKWVDVARLLATAWLMPVSIEASRIRITLPEPPRRAQQVPQSGGTVVVFGCGNILEIWDALKWHDHVRVTAKRKVAAISEALEDLGQR
jgi:DNA-binding transcriptional regulator/RsmH inhibitor MraZ